MAPKADDRDGCALVGRAEEEILLNADSKGHYSWVSSPYAWVSSAGKSSFKIGCVLKVDDAPSYAREKAITTGYRHPLCYAGCLRRYVGRALCNAEHVYNLIFSYTVT